MTGWVIGIFMPFSRRTKMLEKWNQEIAEKSDEISILKNDIIDLSYHKEELNKEYRQIELDLIQKRADYSEAEHDLEVTKSYLSNVQKLILESNEIYQSKISSEEERLRLEREKLLAENQDYIDSYNSDLVTEIANFVNIFKDKTTKAILEYQKYDQLLKEYKHNFEVIVENARHSIYEQENQDFYRIKLQQRDLTEIQKLNEIAEILRDPEPLHKVIWRVYYQNPTGDMINRVLGKEKHCGIYKITNLKNQMCYIGQSVDIAERWKQHIKRGLGAEPTTKNKLYPAMKEFGPENFSFELLEDCERAQLNEKERYWIQFFHGQDFGYNETSGG